MNGRAWSSCGREGLRHAALARSLGAIPVGPDLSDGVAQLAREARA